MSFLEFLEALLDCALVNPAPPKGTADAQESQSPIEAPGPTVLPTLSEEGEESSDALVTEPPLPDTSSQDGAAPHPNPIRTTGEEEGREPLESPSGPAPVPLSESTPLVEQDWAETSPATRLTELLARLLV